MYQKKDENEDDQNDIQVDVDVEVENDENDVDNDTGLLCVFSTKVSSSNIVISPIGFIRGESEEIPITFEFARHFKSGSLLTIVSWSNSFDTDFPAVIV